MKTNMLVRNKKVLDFVNHVKSECKSLGVRFRLSKSNDVHSGDYLYCCGFFDESKRTLAVALNDRTQQQWLSILVHEYCHMMQWKQKSKYWSNDPDKFLLWLQGRYNSWDRKTVYHKYCKARDVEWDADSRAIEVIKKWKLPINIKNYIQEANAYIASYYVMMCMRQWIDTSPCNINKILKFMPCNRILKRSELSSPSQKFVQLCKRYCFE